MAKKAAGPAGGARRGVAKAPAPARAAAKQVTIVAYKADVQASGPVKEWLEGLAAHVGAPVTITMDMALKEFAERRGFRPMPKRLVR